MRALSRALQRDADAHGPAPPHASGNPFFLREAVPFGEWEIPLGFTRDSEGGTCASGCHRVKSYVRSGGATGAGSDASKPTEAPAAGEGGTDAGH